MLGVAFFECDAFSPSFEIYFNSFIGYILLNHIADSFIYSASVTFQITRTASEVVFM